jgi:hypothetical protein
MWVRCRKRKRAKEEKEGREEKEADLRAFLGRMDGDPSVPNAKLIYLITAYKTVL